MTTAFDSVCFFYPDLGNGSRFDRMFPPLGLELVAAGIRDCVRDRYMIDLRFEADWEEPLPANTDLVALSLLWDMPLKPVFQLIRHLREIRPGIRVVAGGRVAESNRKALVTAPEDERVDVVFSGPDDGRFRILVESGLPEKVPGVAFFQDGDYRQTNHFPYGPIPDRPLPDRSLRKARYGMIRRDGLDLGIATDTIQSSRGCPYHCAFCTFNQDAEGRQITYSSRSPESIADELSEIDAPFVVFVDDLAFHRPDHMDRLCDLLLERGIHKTYGIETRINMGMYPAVVEKMARAGFRHVTFGLESMHDHVLEFLDKGMRRETIEKAFAKIRHVPMLFVGNFIIGSVGETREQMLQIPGFARKIGLDSIMIHPLRCRGPEPITGRILATPGYHIDPHSRRVYSDELSAETISGIARQIKRDFWTPAQKFRTAWKIYRLFRSLGVLSVSWHWFTWMLQGKPDAWRKHTAQRAGNKHWPGTNRASMNRC